MNILLLYSRYSAYVHASFSKFAELFGATVHVIRFEPDKNAPFNFAVHPNVHLHNRQDFNKEKILNFIKEKNIDAVLSTGWVDKEYLKVCREFKAGGGLTIGLIDNQWMGTFKQKMLTGVGSKLIRSAYSKLWVPGIYQFEYARRLGFPRYDIMLNYYSADTDLFLNNEPVLNVPKRFIYVGRLLEIKGVEVLYESLKSIAGQLQEAGWKFMVIGNGEYSDKFEALAKQYTSIDYIKFLQQKELAEKTKEGGVFVLPSNYDAWSVAVHEFACLGCPLLLSEAVGSRSFFLRPGYNGEIFITGNAEDLSKRILNFTQLSENELAKMGNRSKNLASTINLEMWAYILKNALEEFKEGRKYQELKRTKYQ